MTSDYIQYSQLILDRRESRWDSIVLPPSKKNAIKIFSREDKWDKMPTNGTNEFPRVYWHRKPKKYSPHLRIRDGVVFRYAYNWVKE